MAIISHVGMASQTAVNNALSGSMAGAVAMSALGSSGAMAPRTPSPAELLETAPRLRPSWRNSAALFAGTLTTALTTHAHAMDTSLATDPPPLFRHSLEKRLATPEIWENHLTNPSVFMLELADTYGLWALGAGVVMVGAFLLYKKLKAPSLPSFAPAIPEPSGISSEKAGLDLSPLSIQEVPGAPSIPGYTVVREFGGGGMSVVYLAEKRDLNLTRQFIIKILKGRVVAKESQESVRFQREAEAMYNIEHSNVIRIFDFGVTQDQQPYIVMEFAGGGDLVGWMKKHPHTADLDIFKTAEEEAAKIIIATLDGLEALNDAGLIHRDIKPANIFLGQDGKPKLGDLGLARYADGHDKITQAGLIMGTPAYFSPEQCNTEELDIRSDIHALGAVLFKMLTGMSPYEKWVIGKPGDINLLLVHFIRVAPIPNAREFNPNISIDMEDILKRALAKNRDERYQTPAEFKTALTHFLEGKAPTHHVSVPPPA